MGYVRSTTYAGRTGAGYTVIPPERIEEPALEPSPPKMKPVIEMHIQKGIPGMQISGSVGPPTLTGYTPHQPVPTVMVQTSYQRRAVMLSIEGYVDMAFDVQASGATDNIRVIAAQSNGIFEKEAKKAVQKWRYNPVYKNGHAVASFGLSHRIVFEMQK